MLLRFIYHAINWKKFIQIILKLILKIYRFKNKFRILTADKKAAFDSRRVIFGNDEFSKI